MFNSERGMDARSVFLVDGSGIIRHSQVYAPGTIPESDDLIPRLQALK